MRPQRGRRPIARPLAGGEVLVAVRGPSPGEGGGKNKLPAIIWVSRNSGRIQSKFQRTMTTFDAISTNNWKIRNIRQIFFIIMLITLLNEMAGLLQGS